MSQNGEQLLLERDVQLAELERLIADVGGGSGALTLIEGAPGIGKTRLLGAACERARGGGLTVLSARGGELERDFAFGIVRQLLEPVLREAEPAERERLMAGAARFCEPVFSGPAAATEQAGDPSYAILHGLYWLLANLAERGPTMIAVDDAHWADRPSLRFLAFLARRLERTGLLVVLASRRGEPGTEADLLRALWQELRQRPIEPALLSEHAVAGLVRSRLGGTCGEELCRACHEATRGNPFLLSELLVELGEGTPGLVEPADVRQLAPRGVAAAVLGRLARLPHAAGALARSVAILGEQAELSHAAALAGLEPEEAVGAAERLAEATILERGRPLRFAHPIVRTAIHEDVPEAERWEAHARAARFLAQEGGEPDAIALQLLAAEPAADPWVTETLREAARGAALQGAPEVAARYLRRALSEPPEARAQVLVELGCAEARAGEAGAREHLAAARELATEPWLEAQATIELAQVLSYEGKPSEATSLALETLAAMHDEPEVARALKMLLLVLAVTDMAARQMTAELVSRAAETVERLADAAPHSLLAIIAYETVMVDGGTAEEVAALAERALAGGRLIEEATAEAPHPYFASVALTLAGRNESAERKLSATLDEALERGSARGFGHASAFRAWSRYRSGALFGAEADARAFLSLAGEPGWDLIRPMAVSALVDVLVERGELCAASAALAEWDAGPRAPGACTAQPLRGSRARLWLAEGRPADALAELTAYGRWEEEWGAANGIFVQWRSAAAIAHAALGETAKARALAREELQRTRRFGAPGAIGVSLGALGLLEGGERGIDLLREAVAHLERSEVRLEHARALVQLGGAIRREGRRSEAREPLRVGLDLAERLGAAVLAETARQELLAAGARPRRPLLTGLDSLTPSERRVAEMAASGQSNRQIAQSLFLTVRTIEMHLSNAYRKLAIGSREELSAALGEEPRASFANGAWAEPATPGVS